MGRRRLHEHEVHVLARTVRETAAASLEDVNRAHAFHSAVSDLELMADDIVARVRQDAPHGVDDALTFLEADPWCMRSGYAKERVLRALGGAHLNPDQRRRGVAVVASYVLGPDRREFRRVARLAWALDADVRSLLLETLRRGDPVAARHALWLLVRTPELDAESLDLGRAREILLEACTTEDVYWRQRDWLVAAARRICSDEWRYLITARALATGEPALLRLLAVLPDVDLSAPERDRLTDLLADDVSSGRLILPIEDLEALSARQ